MLSDPYQDAVENLRSLAPIRVWSMLVTVFGDLAQPDGNAVSGPVLTDLMHEMGIKPEATRTALHRLRSDGWIVSEKCGRTSSHRLSGMGLAQSVKATPVIYRDPKEMPHDWMLVLIKEQTAAATETLRNEGYMPIGNRLYVGSAPAPNTIDALIMAPQNSVGWLSHALETEQLTQDTDALFGAMTRISSSADEFSDLPALKQAALRCLVVHVWRRIALKIPELPRELHSNRWKGHDCRQLVFDFLQAVPRPSLDELTQE